MEILGQMTKGGQNSQSVYRNPKIAALVVEPLLFMGLLVVAASPALGQAVKYGVDGYVLDRSETPIPNADVVVTNRETGISTARATDAKGGFLFANLSPGTYTITVTAEDFRGSMQQSAVLRVDSDSTVRWLCGVGCTALFSPGDLFVLGSAVAMDMPDTAVSLTQFEPADIHSSNGKVVRVTYETGLNDVGAGHLAYSPAGVDRQFQFEEPVWIIGYQTALYGEDGERPKENFLCHTYLGDELFTQSRNAKMNAIYTDAFTREVKLPQGFGIFVDAGQQLNWLPLFNNRTAGIVRVRMRLEVTVIRVKDLVKPMRRVYSTLHSVELPHLFFVPPKRHERRTVVTFDFDGRIHFLGTHVHPYAESMELYNLDRDEQVWLGKSRHDDFGEMVGFDTYSSAEGYPVKAGESYRISSVYNNPTDHEIDAMAGLFVFYSVDE